MRVCLVGPPTLNQYEDGTLARSEIARLEAEHVPLGVLSLAAVAEKLGMFVEVLDLNRTLFQYCWPSDRQYRRVDFCTFAVNELLSRKADVIGFSTMCSSYPLSTRIAEAIKRITPGVTVLFGGPQASVVDVATLKAFPWVDLIVRGEAEQTFPEVLKALSGQGNLCEILGITFRSRGGVIRNQNAPVIGDLDTLPLPAYHLCSGIGQNSFITLEIGRGCPFSCSFCSTNDFFRRRFRLKSSPKVLEQMKYLKDTYGITHFDLVHDMFTVDRKRVVEFCQAIIRFGYKFTWSCSARTDCVDEELLGLMADAGCRSIFFGVETGSSRMQKVIDKNLDLEAAARVVEITGQRRIQITIAMITGFPEEQREDFKASSDFLMNSLRFDHVYPQINLLAPLAETPLLSQYRKTLVLDDVFSDMSHQGWRQDPEDRALIASYPEIFPNFYGLPTVLGREYLQEFCHLFMNGVARFRWLMHALHLETGDFLIVFDAWRTWRDKPAHLKRYYASPQFAADFQQFLRERYLTVINPDSFGVAGLLAYQQSLEVALREQSANDDVVVSEMPFDMVADVSIMQLGRRVRLLDVGADVKSIVDCIRARKRPGPSVLQRRMLAIREGAGGQTELVDVPPIAAEILTLCQNQFTVGDVVREFCSRTGKCEAPEELSREEVCRYTLRVLQRDKLIRFIASSS
jgi:radical SAM superfamily enzyme YgiQ (UPF0313 family)